jgi:hypothetical protein
VETLQHLNLFATSQHGLPSHEEPLCHDERPESRDCSICSALEDRQVSQMILWQASPLWQRCEYLLQANSVSLFMIFKFNVSLKDRRLTDAANGAGTRMMLFCVIWVRLLGCYALFLSSFMRL